MTTLRQSTRSLQQKLADTPPVDPDSIISPDEHNAVHEQLREAQERERQLTGERDTLRQETESLQQKLADGPPADPTTISVDEHNAVHQQLREAQERERQLTSERDELRQETESLQQKLADTPPVDQDSTISPDEHNAVHEQLRDAQERERQFAERTRRRCANRLESLQQKLADTPPVDPDSIISPDEYNAVHEQLRDAQERERQID